MLIDISTVASLELIQNLQNSKSRDCLLGLLNETLTPMGARLLKSNILQPPTEIEKIIARHDAVAELSSREDVFYATRQGKLPCLMFDVTDAGVYSAERFRRCRQGLDCGRLILTSM